ncbi:MAG: hypothetical protein ACRDBL_01345 [Rhabdaerophilum sp.]
MVTFAAYGGVCVAESLFWLWQVEGQRPDMWDLSGASLCLMGAAIILFGPLRSRTLTPSGSEGIAREGRRPADACSRKLPGNSGEGLSLGLF